MGIFNKPKRRTDANTQEFAKAIDWKPQWEAGAPMPQVFSNSRQTFLIYLIRKPQPIWDGTFVTVIDNTSNLDYPLALVEFDGATFRFGIANDEVFRGLPLYDKGLKMYSAHLIENSMWIDELKKIHKVHPNFNEDHWKNKKHYSLLFHDEIFEVIATNYKIEIFDTTFENLAIEVSKRMNR